jgi:hypothetical protein
VVRSPDKPGTADERRRNQPLREMLDEMITLVRSVSRHGSTMSAEDLEYAQERMQWLADEIWQSATRGNEEI